MKVYFACSIKGEPGDKEERSLIINTLKDLGHIVLSEIFLHDNPNLKDGVTLSPEEVYQRDIDWINESGVIVADVSRASLGVGYEIGYGLKSGKKVIALCHNNRFDSLSFMMKANTDPNFKVISWENAKDLKKSLEGVLNVKTN